MSVSSRFSVTRVTAPRGVPRRQRGLLRAVALCALLGLLTACAHQQAPRNPMAKWVPSPNFDERRPNLIVLHYTDQESVKQSLHTLSTRNSGGRVSAHYLIGSDGSLYQLVSEVHRAWHAGPGGWGTISDVNSASIGIELDNDGKSPFAAAQIESLLRLLDDLTLRLSIPKAHVVGHEDIAPTRKRDPGPLFPWKTLAQAGYGHWPNENAPPAPADFDPWAALHQLGYPLQDRAETVRAFRSHYRGMEGDTLDAEDLRILHDLSRQLLPPE